jgi:hypothetical protein
MSAKAATTGTMDKTEAMAKGEGSNGCYGNRGDDEKRILVISVIFGMRGGRRG